MPRPSITPPQTNRVTISVIERVRSATVGPAVFRLHAADLEVFERVTQLRQPFFDIVGKQWRAGQAIRLFFVEMRRASSSASRHSSLLWSPRPSQVSASSSIARDRSAS